MEAVRRFIAEVFDRRVNVRLLAVLLAGAVVLGGTVYVVHGVQTRRYADYFLGRAREAAGAGRTEEAIGQYDRYLKLVPEDPDALAEYGLLLAETAPNRYAYETLSRALIRQPDRTDVRRKLTDVAMRLGRFADARDQLENHLLIGSPGDAELLEKLGRCQIATDQIERAVESLDAAVQNAPGRLDAYLLLAQVLRDRRLNRAEEADRKMRLLVDQNPKSARAHRLRADYLLALDRPDEARTDADAALALAPDDQDALWTAVRCALANGRTDDARAIAARAIQADPKHARMYSVLADLEQKAGKPAEAIAQIEAGLKQAPGHQELLWHLAMAALDAGLADKAEEAVNQLRGVPHPQPLVGYAAARIHFLRGNWKAAADQLELVRSGLNRWPGVQRDAEYWLARCYGGLGAIEQRLAALNRAAALDRLSIPVRMETVAALSAAGRFDEALAEQERLMQLPGAPAAGWIELARMRFIRAVRQAPAQRDWSAVREAIQKAEQADPRSAQATVVRAEVLVAEGRRDEAESTLREAIQKAPKQPALWTALAGLSLGRRDRDGLDKVLDEAQKALGDVAAVRLLRAEAVSRRGGDEAAGQLQALLQGAERFAPDERSQLQRGVLAGLLRVGDLAAAARLGRQIAAADQSDLAMRLLLFELAMRLNDGSGMTDALDEIGRVEGEGPHWHYGQAVRLWLAAGQGDKAAPTQALKHLAQAEKLRPEWGRAPLLAAQVHDLLGDKEKALSGYLRAIKLGDDSPAAVRRAVQLLYAERRLDEADRLVRSVEARQPSASGELDRLSSSLSLRLEDFDRALETARRAAANSRDWRDHAWLGQVLAIHSQRAKAAQQTAEAEKTAAEAERAFRKAVDLAGDVPETWLALVHYLARTGRAQDAEQAIGEAQGRIAPALAPLAVAQAYELVGKPREAAARYAAALSAAGSDPAVDRRVAEFYLRSGRALEAQGLLEKMLAPGAKAPPPDAAWARRQLAVLLASRPEASRFDRALALVEENLAAAHAAVEDRRTKVVVLLADPQKRFLKDAAGILQGIVDEPSAATPDDRLLLARLLTEAGDWPQAREVLRALAAAEGKDPRFVAVFAEALLDHGEVGPAEVWVPRLRQSAPGEFVTAALQARIALDRGQVDEALAAVRAYVDDKAAQPPAREARLLAAAAWCQEQASRLKAAKSAQPPDKLLGEAEAMLRQYVAATPTDPTPLVAMLVRQGRADDAVAAAETALAHAGPARMAQVCGMLVQEGKTPPDQAARVQKLVRAAADKHKRAPVLLMLLADLTTIEGRFDQTEALYREVVAQDPNHVAALNNLAVLLAHQNKQPEEALRLIDKAIELAGPDGTLLDSRATVYLALRQPKKALADLERAIADTPRPTRFFHRAMALRQAGQEAEAKSAMAEAIRLGLKAGDLHPLERDAYARLGGKPE